jgi:hypothetical protein
MTEPNVTSRPSWQPDADITTHAGSPLTIDADFFTPPPAAIGEVISAATTLPKSTQPMPDATRWAIIAGGGVGLAIVFQLLFSNPLVSLSIGGVAAATAWFFTRFHYNCSYVGTKGLVKYSLTGSRMAMPKENILLFADAHSLYTSTTRNYTNGIYTGTNYSYRWTKNSGSQHAITGTHRGENNAPKENDQWHFANVAESAWTSHLLQTLDAKLAEHGYIEFPLTVGLQAVRVGEGFLEFVTKKDGPQRVRREDMRDILLGSGTFQFKHQDSHWWSGKGKFSFDYGNIPNARIFLICLKELTDIYWD